MADYPNRGLFVWHDLMTTDAARAQAFLTELLGWQVQEMPMGPQMYRMVSMGDVPFSGIVEEKSIPMSHWIAYIGCNDVDATVEQVTKLGGTSCVPPTDIPGIGRFAVVSDPQGGFFSPFHGTSDTPHLDPKNMRPGMVCWNELWTSDPEAAVAFYGKLFGWKSTSHDMGGGHGLYHKQSAGARDVGGIVKLPNPAPTYWCPYFFVEQVDDATDRATRLGGKLIVPPMDIPNTGRFSVLSEPTGATFALFAVAAGQSC